MKLTLNDEERLYCVLNRKGEMLIPPTKNHNEAYRVWSQNDTDSRIFMLKPVGFSPRPY